jgi:hypothetical protein
MNITQRKGPLFAAFIFSGLALLMTFPLVLNMGSGVRGLGDPLLNTWILSWNIHKLGQLDFSNFFDANIFFPHKRTLAYSELLLPQSVAAFPVMLILGNPIFAHNFALLFGLIASGLGMYFLAFALTKNHFGGIVAGVIFAFSPFMLAHVLQIQLLTAGGIPMTFLFLHKFF